MKELISKLESLKRLWQKKLDQRSWRLDTIQRLQKEIKELELEQYKIMQEIIEIEKKLNKKE